MFRVLHSRFKIMSQPHSFVYMLLLLLGCWRETFGNICVCLFVHRHLSTSSSLTDHQWKFGEDYGSCQAGISNFLTEVSNTQACFLCVNQKSAGSHRTVVCAQTVPLVSGPDHHGGTGDILLDRFGPGLQHVQ